MHYLRLMFAAFMAMALSGCFSINSLRTMHKLSSLDVVEDEMTEFIFGVMADPRVKALPNSSKFILFLERDGEAPIQTDVPLVRAEPSMLAFSKVPQDSRRILTLFKFSAQGKQEILKQQAFIREAKANGVKGSFGFSVNVDFCKTAPVNYAREKFNIYISPHGQGELMPWVENMSVKEALDKIKETELPDC